MTNKYGLNIQMYRKENDLSQLELAKKLNVTGACVSAWEVGRNEPSMEMMCKMADIFGCTVENLMGRKKTDSEPVEITINNPELKAEFEQLPIMNIYSKLESDQQQRLINYAINLLAERK